MRYLLFAALVAVASAAVAESVQFVVVDPQNGKPIPTAKLLVLSSDNTEPLTVAESGLIVGEGERRAIYIRPGETLTVVLQDEPPIREITITVTASRLRRTLADTGAGTTRTKEDIGKFGGGASNDIRNVTRTTAGVAQDSGGQQHIRGEHSEITYVIDGVPLPDTLSGRQGSIVVPSTIQSVDILLGGFAPEYGGQTAAILDISTIARSKAASKEMSLSAGSFDNLDGDLTATGSAGEKLGYVLHLSGSQTRAATEPKQPDIQTAHNAGRAASIFGKFDFVPNPTDRLSLTISANPGVTQVGNRTGLPERFAASGQGFGFLGLRNADGTRPDANGRLGSDPIILQSQQAAGMAIDQREQNDFATLSWQRKFDTNTQGVIGFAILHSGQQVTNSNPVVDMLALPVDSSIEFNPTASRHVHHTQLSASLTKRSNRHEFKVGGLIDIQSGRESYHLVPASQLALDALAATAPQLAPSGHASKELDINGNPIYIADSNITPTLRVNRKGYYAAVYVQDTWKPSKSLTANFGLRLDAFQQSQDLGQPTVRALELSPRINLSYTLSPGTILRGSYNRLFNTPPLAQGAILGKPLRPPVLDQYDLSIERKLGAGQSVKLAYYAKQIRNQIDVGLLIPGSEVGLYSGVNLERTGVHGLELSYELSPQKQVGWSALVNYTLSAAKPKGLDNTGAEVEPYNDHDQRHTIGLGISYTLKSGLTGSILLEHGSGLASSVIGPSERRTPRTSVDLHLDSGPKLFGGRGSIQLDVTNLFDSRQVINYQSAFSGTRFMAARKITLTASFKF